MDRSKWEYKKWADVLNIINGRDYKEVVAVDGAYPICGSGGEIGRANDFLCPANTVIIGRKGNINKPIFIEEKFWNIDTAFGLVAKESYLLPRFLFYFCLHYDFERHNKAVTIPSLTKGDLLKINMLVPLVEDQQRIVAELDCLNEMIAVKQKQLKEFDKLAQSIFYDMFGDDGGFEKVKLGDVVEVVSGLVDPNMEPYCSQLHVSPANIISGTNEIVNCIKAKDEGLISDKYPFKAGMVLYSKIRPNLNKVAVANFDGICSADMYPLTVLPKANNVFITKLLSSKQFLEYAIKNSGRARMPKLNRETLFSYSFKLPPLSLQQQFAEKISAIEAQKELVKQSIAETQALLDYTMDKYFG